MSAATYLLRSPMSGAGDGGGWGGAGDREDAQRPALMGLEIDLHPDRRLAPRGPVERLEAVAAAVLAGDDSVARPGVHSKYLSAHMPLALPKASLSLRPAAFSTCCRPVSGRRWRRDPWSGCG